MSTGGVLGDTVERARRPAGSATTIARKSRRRYSRFGKARPYRVVMRRCCPAPMLIVPDGGRSLPLSTVDSAGRHRTPACRSRADGAAAGTPPSRLVPVARHRSDRPAARDVVGTQPLPGAPMIESSSARWTTPRFGRHRNGMNSGSCKCQLSTIHFAGAWPTEWMVSPSAAEPPSDRKANPRVLYAPV